MIRDPTIFPFCSISWPFALSGNSTWATPVTTSGYTIPRSTVVTTVISTAAMRFRLMFMIVSVRLSAGRYASLSAVMMTSIILMPMNGMMMPPTP